MRGNVLAQRDLSERKVQCGALFFRVEGERIGKCLFGRLEAPSCKIGLPKEHAIVGIAAFELDCTFGQRRSLYRILLHQCLARPNGKGLCLTHHPGFRSGVRSLSLTADAGQHHG